MSKPMTASSQWGVCPDLDKNQVSARSHLSNLPCRLGSTKTDLGSSFTCTSRWPHCIPCFTCEPSYKLNLPFVLFKGTPSILPLLMLIFNKRGINERRDGDSILKVETTISWMQAALAEMAQSIPMTFQYQRCFMFPFACESG